MKLLLFFALAFSLATAGCLNEKQLEGQPSPLPTATATTTTNPTGTATATAISTATPTPTPSPTVEQGGACSIITPQNRDTFSKSSVVEYFITFDQLPQSITTVTVKCDTSENGISMDIVRQGSSTFARKSCIYSPSSTRTYTASATAGGAACTKTITVTA